MDISVIVPFHNEEKYIEKCIRALIFQDYPKDKYQVIMVNNNSTDRSAGIVQKYQGITLLEEKKAGSYAARNRGIAESRGKIIAFTDSDCAPQRDWLYKISTVMRDSKTQLVQGRVRFGERGSLLSLLEAYENEKAAYVYSSYKREFYYGYTNNMAVRKELFENLGNFVEIMRGGDTVFLHKVLDRYSCEAVQHSPEICVLHLEIDRLFKYFLKNYTYGRSCRNLEKIAPSMPLTTSERVTILRRVIRKNRFSMKEHILLLFLLFSGSVLFELGQLKASFGSASKQSSPGLS